MAFSMESFVEILFKKSVVTIVYNEFQVYAKIIFVLIDNEMTGVQV